MPVSQVYFYSWSDIGFAAGTTGWVGANTTNTVTGAPQVMHISDDDAVFQEATGYTTNSADTGTGQTLDQPITIDGSTSFVAGTTVLSQASTTVVNSTTSQIGQAYVVSIDGGTTQYGFVSTIPLEVGDSISLGTWDYANDAVSYASLYAPSPLDYIVEGTGGDDVIDGSYVGDPDGDRIDNSDHSDGSNADSVYGGAGNDSIVAGLGDDTVFGADGSDTILGGDGNDTLDGDDGAPLGAADSINGGAGNDQIIGDYGNDTLIGGVGDDTVYAGDDDDVVYGDGGADQLFGQAGDDSLEGGGGDDTIYGGLGNDTIDVGVGADIAYGEAGNDYLIDGSTGNVAATLFGGDGDDTLLSGTGDSNALYDGGAGNDLLQDRGGSTGNQTWLAGGGNDTVEAAGGADTIDGGAGDDSIDGGTGDDSIDSGTGDDSIDGGDGDDSILGDLGNDVILAGAGDDTVRGGIGDDTIIGGSGNDEIYGNEDDDSIVGDLGDDTVYGETGDDFVSGGAGNDSLEGNEGADTIIGGTGDDWIRGSFGNDSIEGNEGDDYLWGGYGDDTIVFADNFGDDTVEGEEADETDGDTIDLSAVTSDLTLDLTSANPEAGTFTDGTDTVSFVEIENIVLGGGADTLVLGTGGGDDRVEGFTIPTESGGVYTGVDRLDVSTLLDTNGAPVNTDDVTITSDANGDAVLGFPSGESLTLVGVTVASINSPAILEAMGIPQPNYVVDGTGGADQIDGTYITDPDGDVIDGLDNAAGTNADSVAAGAGDDTVLSYVGNDTIDAGAGNDTVDAGDGDDVVLGGAGDDTLQGWFGDDSLEGGAGDDSLIGFLGDDTLAGGTGDDSIEGGDDEDLIVLENGFGDDTIDGGDGGLSDFDTLDASAVTENLTLDLSAQGAANPESGTLTSDVAPIAPPGQHYVRVFEPNDPSSIVGFGVYPQGSIDFSDGTFHWVLVDDNDSVLTDSQGGLWPQDATQSLATDLDGLGIVGSNIGSPGLSTHTDGNGNSFQAGWLQTYGAGAGTVPAQTYLIISDAAGGDPVGSSTFTGSNNALADFNYSSFTPSGDQAEFNDIETVLLGSGDDTVLGSSGDDSVSTGAGADTVDGGAGNDSFDVGAGDGDVDTVVLEDGDGDDTITGFEAPTPLGGGAFTPQDQIDVSGLTDADGNPVNVLDVTITDTNGDGTGDAILSFPNGESITLVGVDPAGIDSYSALVALGIPGTDEIVSGTAGSDVIGASYTGDPDGDMIDGLDNAAGNNDDSVDAGAGNDSVYSGAGDDTVDGGTGDDLLQTGLGDDYIIGGAGNDTINSQSGQDTVYAGDGDDVVGASIGGDYVDGGAGNDSIDGGGGADVISGDAGNDVITVNENDTATGGDGDDYFEVSPGFETGVGSISITGGEGGETLGDTLDFNGLIGFGDVTYTNADPGVGGGLTGFATLGDGTVVNFTEIENVIICFTEGTRIATPRGVREIEDLEVGDLVVTRDHGLQPIRWVGKRTVPARGALAPIRFDANVMGNERPLYVSPQHRMLVQGYEASLLFGESEVLASAKHLVNGSSVTEVHGGEVTYVHIMFDQHEIIYAEGAASESFYPGGTGLDAVEAEAREELFTIFPELRSHEGAYGDTARLCLKAHESRLLRLG
ncbi:Hint domain-containing protein [Lentibacter sp.]|uniref:Hint domain-containing protein n=1 Tax=Lentibacter sp. TaxID=2024994 RepID=UPI003F6D4327